MFQLKLIDQGQETLRMGDYASAKSYEVWQNGQINKQANGYVIQLIQKNSVAQTHSGELKSSLDFSNFTSGNVNFMCDSYIESFPIKNGVSVNFDKFGNGAVSKYEKKQAIIVEAPYDTGDEEYMTAGQITQKGTNVLFIDPNKIEQLNRLPWIKDKKGPANGLYTLPESYWQNIINIGSDSQNTPVHEVVATWDFQNNRTNLKVSYSNNVTGGGKKRSKNKTITKKTTKQKKRKSVRS